MGKTDLEQSEHGVPVPTPLEIGTRRVHLAGCTSQPTAGWVVQQASQLTWTIQDERLPLHFLIHDRDAKFPAAFDTVFAAEEIEIIRTPFRAPTANAVAERWIRSVREECLDHLLIVHERHRTSPITISGDRTKALTNAVRSRWNERPKVGESRVGISWEASYMTTTAMRREAF